MNILHFHPTQRATPLEMQIADMATYQKAQGHNVTVVTFPKTVFEMLCSKKGLPVLSFNVERTVEHFKFWNALEKVMSEKKFDVIHLHASQDVPRFLQLKQLQKLCGMQQPKIILQIHLVISQTRKDSWTWIVNSGISEVWCTDKKSKDTVIEYTGFNGLKIFVFNYGKNLPSDYFIPQKQAREALGLGTNALVVGALSEIEKTTGIEEVVRGVTELMAKNPDLHLVHMGGVPEQNSEAVNFNNFLMEWISFLKADVRSRIHFLGAKAEAPRFLKAFDLYIYANSGETFPFVLLNAQLASLPVIAVNSGRVTDLVVENETGYLCEPENSAAILGTLEQALTTKDKWPELSARAFEKVRSEFDQKIIFDKMLGRYAYKSES